MSKVVRSVPVVAALASIGLQSFCPVIGADSVYTGTASKNSYHKPVTFKQYLSDHPKVKSATIGAGVGTAAGAVTGLVTGKSVVKGALAGAGTGAGVGLIRSSEILNRHPIVKDIATGTTVGLGLGLSGAGGGHHSTAKVTAVGAAVGLGVGLLKNLK